MRPLIAAALLAIAAVAASSAQAQSRWLDEAKLGLDAHDIALGGTHKEPGVDVNGELLFTSPPLLDAIGGPRPHVGVAVNTSGATSYAYFGLTWTASIFDRAFISGALGGAVHNGKIDTDVPNRKGLGSRVLFHEYVELGLRATPVLSLSVFLDHMSNANLARRNAGMTDVGLRTGFKF
ncbi:MAG TPA: acyloxyacyl hydrolase [Stellaceae bacterium]